MMFKLYNDLLIEIDIYKSDIKMDIDFRDKLISELNPNAPHDMKGMQYSDMPKGNNDYTSLDRLYLRNKERLDILNKSIEGNENRLKVLEEKKKIQDDALKLCEGLSHRVFDLHRLQHKQLKEVAVILGYSYQYIKEINNQIDRDILNDK